MTDRPAPSELESFLWIQDASRELFGRDWVSLQTDLMLGRIEVDEFMTMLEQLRARFRREAGRTH